MLELPVRVRALLEEEEGRRGGEGEDGGSDQHHDGNELASRITVFLSDRYVKKTYSKRNQPPQIAEGPAPARDAAHGFGIGELGEEGGDQVLAGGEEEVGED